MQMVCESCGAEHDDGITVPCNCPGDVEFGFHKFKTKFTEAKKFDTDKTQWTACPTHAMEDMAKIMTLGVKKYGKYNFLAGEGLAYSRLVDAAFRHLMAFWHREDVDTESGMSHAAHAACCCLMLLEYVKVGPRNDDRPA